MVTTISRAPAAWAASAICGHVGDRAEHVGGLDDDAGGVGVDGGDHRGLGVDGGRPGARSRCRRRGRGSGWPRRSADAGRRRGSPSSRRVTRVGHHHRLGAGGRAVVHRGVGHLQAGQGRDLGLELEQHLQRALGDLRLVGRVAGQEFRALDEVVDAGRHVVAIGAGAAEERARAPPARFRAGQRRQRPLDLQLAGVRRQVDQASAAARRRARRRTGRRSIGGADDGQHVGAVGWVSGAGSAWTVFGSEGRAGRLRRRRGPSGRRPRPGWRASAWRTSRRPRGRR